MAIIPITPVNSLEDLIKAKQVPSQQENGLPFQSFFEDAINNVVETQREVDEQALLLSTGQTDDVHNLSIASTKASLSLDLLVELRNKTMEAYNELIRMNI
jgi:flagellar hook-basal body complex protein FliE